MDGVELRVGFEQMDFDRVHRWLTTSYWSLGVSREAVVEAAKNSSLLVGAFWQGHQVGYVRVVSDRVRFGWICDVWVDEEARGRGVASTMLQRVLDDPAHRSIKRWLLATQDAQPLYRKHGFKTIEDPERWMILTPASASEPERRRGS